jgi:hypothetical protein
MTEKHYKTRVCTKCEQTRPEPMFAIKWNVCSDCLARAYMESTDRSQKTTWSLDAEIQRLRTLLDKYTTLGSLDLGGSINIARATVKCAQAVVENLEAHRDWREGAIIALTPKPESQDDSQS